MDPWRRLRWRRRWRSLRPFIVATVLAVIVVLILLALAQHLEGEEALSRLGLHAHAGRLRSTGVSTWQRRMAARRGTGEVFAVKSGQRQERGAIEPEHHTESNARHDRETLQCRL